MGDFMQELCDTELMFHIQIGGWFVQQHDLRLLHQSARQHRLLVLTGRELVELAVSQIIDAQPLQHGEHYANILPGGLPIAMGVSSQ
jgi:hypothetical protein